MLAKGLAEKLSRVYPLYSLKGKIILHKMN